jgi:hypothetical protein
MSAADGRLNVLIATAGSVKVISGNLTGCKHYARQFVPLYPKVVETDLHSRDRQSNYFLIRK